MLRSKEGVDVHHSAAAFFTRLTFWFMLSFSRRLYVTQKCFGIAKGLRLNFTLSVCSNMFLGVLIKTMCLGSFCLFDKTSKFKAWNNKKTKLFLSSILLEHTRVFVVLFSTVAMTKWSCSGYQATQGFTILSILRTDHSFSQVLS